MKNRVNGIGTELAIIALVLILSYWFFSSFDALEKIVEFSSKYERFEVDELISTSIVLAFCMVWFSIRRWREAVKAKAVINQKNEELQKSFDEINQLKGILPLCSFCKKVRDDSGYWEQVDTYIQKHSDAVVSHSLCPECIKKHYPEEFLKISSRKEENYFKCKPE